MHCTVVVSCIVVYFLGVFGSSDTLHDVTENNDGNRIFRHKRSSEILRGPSNANQQSRYVELVLVVDNGQYRELGGNLSAVHLYCKEIANIVNSLFTPLNIFIALVEVVVWTERDEIQLSTNGDQTLTNFLFYRRERLTTEHPNDNAQLLTRVQFERGVVGKALKGPICTNEFSGGVVVVTSDDVGLVAANVAHQLGHNLGMEHDTAKCDCPSERCIMATGFSPTPTHWSSCSLDYLAGAFDRNMDYCLRNKPTSLFESPTCGNGFVESGEECDCGLKDHCDNPCCNATSCTLHANASCATGECCDLSTCRPKPAGSECRSSQHECDLPEYCAGGDENCPHDAHKMDGDPCHTDEAYCYGGWCRSRTEQCQLLWGPSGRDAHALCYPSNAKGARHGNCGYDKVNNTYAKCLEKDIHCGLLQCRHLSERLEFGMESVSILSHTFINSKGNVIPCRTAIIDLGLGDVDPGLVPDGAKCGERKMCVGQKCVDVETIRQMTGTCPSDCNGNGVCNNKGHCHCRVGFSPPNCDSPGLGGSLDSGPPSSLESNRLTLLHSKLEIQPRILRVDPDNPATITCILKDSVGQSVPLDGCEFREYYSNRTWELNQGLSSRQNTINANSSAYHGRGLQHGECGLTLGGFVGEDTFIVGCRVKAATGADWRYAAMLLSVNNRSLQQYHLQPTGVTFAHAGSDVTLSGTSEHELSECQFTLPPSYNTVRVSFDSGPASANHSLARYHGAGLNGKQCGLTLVDVQPDMSGFVRGSVRSVAPSTWAGDFVELIVATPPKTPPLLTVSSNALAAGDTLRATCVVEESRPIANITWFFGEEVVQSDGFNEEPPVAKWLWNHDPKTIKQHLTRVVYFSDDGKVLRCQAGHVALPSGIQNSNSYVISVTGT